MPRVKVGQGLLGWIPLQGLCPQRRVIKECMCVGRPTWFAGGMNLCTQRKTGVKAES